MSARKKPNIVVVVMDCVRAQNLPLYGYHKPTAPILSEIAGEGIRYNNAISVAEQTLSSTTGLFTGTYPSTHGLFILGDKLNPGLATLAQGVASSDYETCCINSANPHVSSFSGLDRGFERRIEASHPLRQAWLRARRWQLRRKDAATSVADTPRQKTSAAAGQDAAAVKREGRMYKRLRWALTSFLDGGAKAAFRHARRILSQRPDVPKFLYVHLMETHYVYHPPRGLEKRFLPDTRGRRPWEVNQNPLTFLSGDAPMDELDLAIVEGLYNGTLCYTDRLFGSFYHWLRREGKHDDTILVLTADHGENFGEHGFLGHGQCVYDTVVRVPLLVWGPVVEQRHRGAVIDQVVQNIDLTASCLDWASCSEHAVCEQKEGVPLPLSPGAPRTRAAAISQSVFVFDPSHLAVQREAGLADRAAVAARTETHKLVWNATEPPELYDLTRDPGETVNVMADEQQIAQALHKEIEPFLPRFDKARTVALERFRGAADLDVDPAVQERLRDLGYID